MNPRAIHIPVFLAIAAFVAAIVIGCDSRGSTQPDGNLRPAAGAQIVFVGPPQDDPRSEPILAGARRIAGGIDYLRFEFVSPPATDKAQNIKAVRDAMTSGAAGVCVYLTAADELAPLAKEIQSSATVLVTMGQQPTGITPYTHVNIDLPGGAELIAENLARCAEGRKTYALVDERSRSTISRACYERFISHRPGISEMTQVDERDAFAAGQPTSTIISEIVGNFRSTSIVVTLSPEVWLSSNPPYALDEGRRFVTLSAVEPLWSRLRSGEAAALVGPIDGEIGEAAINAVLRGVAHETTGTPVRTVPCHFVTRENLDDFAEKYRAVMKPIEPKQSTKK